MELVEGMGSKMSCAYNRSALSCSMAAAKSTTKAVDCDSRRLVVVVEVGNPWGRFWPEHEGPRHGTSAGVGEFGHWPQGNALGVTFAGARVEPGLLELTSCVKAENEKKV